MGFKLRRGTKNRPIAAEAPAISDQSLDKPSQSLGTGTSHASIHTFDNLEKVAIPLVPDPIEHPSNALEKSKRPKDTPFRQQRLPAWRPVLTPKNVIPTLIGIGIIFIPLGILFLLTSMGVQEYRFDYSTCLKDAPYDHFSSAPSPLGSHPFEWRRFKAGSLADSTAQMYGNKMPKDAAHLCEIKFTVAKEMKAPIVLYYRLSNYYQNQRLYVKSVDWRQLKGDAVARENLDICAPLIGPRDDTQSVYYPCGLIANSMFNDTISNPLLAQAPHTAKAYDFTAKGIAWPTDHKRYGPSKYNLSQVRPPPFWRDNPVLVDQSTGMYKVLPDLEHDEHFQVWMRVAGLPVFRKPYSHRTNGNLPIGTYSILIHSVFEVSSYGGSKSIVLSTTSWLGGKNSFLGIAYLAVGGVFLIVGLLFLFQNYKSPRRLGDPSYLSWNQPS